VLRIYLLVVLVMMLLERRLVFFPTSDGNWSPSEFKFEDARFKSDDGTRLHGWYLEHPQPRAVVLFAHGNAGNLSHRGPRMDYLRRRLGVSVMIFDYRGYGQSEGSPNEAGILADARAARRWLAEHAGIDARDIVLMGESLGAGVMVDLAARDGARGLILENAFTSLPDVAARHYWWLPVRWVMRTRLDALAKIGDYTGPLLACHGTADSIVPFDLGRRLFDAAPDAGKVFCELPGHDHNDPLPEEWYVAVDRFLTRIMPSTERT
jgi:fermentation-respiration switch protein FrsA (DUF1100 family)